MSLWNDFKALRLARRKLEQAQVPLPSDDDLQGYIKLHQSYKQAGIPFPTGLQGWQTLGPFGQAGWYVSPWSYVDSKIDFAREVGDLRLSSIMMAGIRWAGRGMAAPRPMVVEVDKKGEETEITDHELSALLEQPNPYYSGAALMKGIAASWIMAATAYVIKSKSKAGRTVELWYEPHWTIRPWWPQTGVGEFIEYYEVLRNGRWYKLDPENVIPIRDGIDPETRLGMNGTASIIRDLFSDQQAAKFIALLLRHGLVPPIGVSLGTKDYPFQGSAADFKADLVRQMSGDSAGEPLVTKGPMELHKLGYDYSSVGMRDIRQTPEERFCSAMGISPISLYFGTSKESATYANVESYLKHDYRSYIVPTLKEVALALKLHLLPDFGEVGTKKVTWDYSQVAEMQADQTAEWKRIEDAYKSRIIDQAEAREALSYMVDEQKHRDVYYPVLATHVTVSPLEQTPSIPSPIIADKNRKAIDIDDETALIEAGADWWRTYADDEAAGLIDATVKPNGEAR